MNQYRAHGQMHGYPYGVTITVEAETIEEAMDAAAETLVEPIQVSGPLHTEAKP